MYAHSSNVTDFDFSFVYVVLTLYGKVCGTTCYDYLSMSLGGSEKNRWLQLDVTISML